MSDMREAFEDRHRVLSDGEETGYLSLDEDGDYKWGEVQEKWETWQDAWQAARTQGGQGAEPVAWEFYQDGKWHRGMDKLKHKENTIAAGFPVRDLYTHPQPAQPEGDGWMPTLDWAVEKCRALQSQGFDRVRLDVLEKDLINAIEAHRPQPPQGGE